MSHIHRHDRRVVLGVEGLEGKLLLSGGSQPMPTPIVGKNPSQPTGPVTNPNPKPNPSPNPAASWTALPNTELEYKVTDAGIYKIKEGSGTDFSTNLVKIVADKSGNGFDVKMLTARGVISDHIATPTQTANFAVVDPDGNEVDYSFKNGIGSISTPPDNNFPGKTKF